MSTINSININKNIKKTESSYHFETRDLNGNFSQSKLNFSSVLCDITLKDLLTIQVNIFLFDGAVAKCAPILEVFVWYKLRKIKLA